MNASAHELAVERAGTTFAGTLRVPAGGGRGTVLMHPGSGPSDRDNDLFFPPIRERLLAGGYAVCSFDKRGVGGSTGRWQDAGIVEQADDAIAQLDALLGDARAPEPVGLFGHSQGGWVVLEAASREPRAAFVVSSSGPGVTPAEQERYSTEAGLLAGGATAEEIANALRTYDDVVALLRSGLPYEDGRDRLSRLPGWERFSFLLENEVTWRFSAGIIDYDPRPALERIAVPILALFGEADTVTPAAASVDAYRAHARPELLTVRTFPGAGHRLAAGEPPRLVEDVPRELVAFLDQTVDGRTIG